jgi:hypothetical protein
MKPFAVSSFVYHIKLWVMESFLVRGFPLSLYQPAEYGIVFGYLDRLTRTHLLHLDRMQACRQTAVTWASLDREIDKAAYHLLQARADLYKGYHQVMLLSFNVLDLDDLR